MKIKRILLIAFVIIVIISGFSLIFRKEYKALVIKDVSTLIFNDSIIYVSYYKEDGGSGIKTKLKNYDTPFCFSGFNEKLHAYYFGFAQKGDMLIKKKNADSFYIKRNDTLTGFSLSKCQ